MSTGSSAIAFLSEHVRCRATRPSEVDRRPKLPLFSTVQHGLRELRRLSMRMDVEAAVKTASQRLLDAFVDSVFRFEDQRLLPSQSNFAPVDEIGKALELLCVQGEIPPGFPQGVYIRNGPNPLFGTLQSAVSLFGTTSETWIEGEGMVHAIYFAKDRQGKWKISCRNRYIESETHKIEKARKKPSFLPTIEGDPPAILAAYLLNQLRFGKADKDISNTNVFEHAGKCYSIAENHLPQELDVINLESLDSWDVNGAWDRPFTSHPKRVPGTGELVIMGVDAREPYFVLGVVSADGKRLKHKVDLEFKRSTLCHEIGITEKYNIIMDCPLTMDIGRVVKGGSLIKYEKNGYARIGVMPRYGDAGSVKWFYVEPHCTFHIINCFESGDHEVVVRGCRARWSIIPGPELGRDKFEWFSRGFKRPIPDAGGSDSETQDGMFFSRAHEWRLDMETGEVRERYLTGTDVSMDFPFINNCFTGLRSKYGYTQVVDSPASSSCGSAKYGGLAKLRFEEITTMTANQREGEGANQPVKLEHHKLGPNQFCSGATFVAKHGGAEEDDGWIISFVHDEETNTSQVHVIDAKKFVDSAVAKITLPYRVPYGFHSTFISTAS